MGCPGHSLAGVHTVRARADVDRLIEELPTVRRVVVVGGGYIGLEAAAVLIKLGNRRGITASDRLTGAIPVAGRR